ncbi:MAG: EAL domain-containing protein [Wenzhouxiangella sp.]|nr:EAL domain-containing protein [Wenzhouxiangella sp.]
MSTYLPATTFDVALAAWIFLPMLASVVGLVILNRRLAFARESARQAIGQRDAMAEDVPVGIFSLIEHPDGTRSIEYFSDRCLNLLGVAREAVEARFDNVFSQIHAEDMDRIAQRMEQAREAVAPWATEFRVLHGQRTAVLRMEATPRVQNGLIYWSGIVSDVTEQREAELRFQTLFQQSPLSIIVHDPDSGEVIDANPAAWQAYGFDDFETLRRRRRQKEPPYGEDEAMTLIRRAAAGEPQHFEWKSFDRDGQVFWEMVSLVPVMLRGRLCVFSTALDITDRRASEQALAEREALLEAVSRLSGTGGWQLEAADQKVRWTDHTFRIHELPISATVPLEQALSFYTADSRRQLEVALVHAMETGEGYDLTLEMKTATGRQITVRSLCQPELKDGKVVRLIGAFQDVTEAVRNQRRLAEAERRFRRLVENAPVNILVHDAQTGEILDANPAAVRAYGAGSLAELQQRKSEIWADAPYDLTEALDRIHQARTSPAGPFDWLCRRLDGTEFWQLVSLTPARIEQRDCVLAACVDVSLRREAENLLRESEERFRHLLKGVPGVAVIGYHSDGRIHYWNKAAEEFYGYAETEALDQDVVELLVPAEQASRYRDIMHELIRTGEIEGGELNLRQRDGTLVTVFASHAFVHGPGRSDELFRIDIDLTERKRHEHELMQIANYDSLTGLPNRHLMAEMMRELCARSRRNDETLAVCYLDLDDFKPINDRHGHDVGDQVLVMVAERLRHMVRGSDLVSRLGGDEFVILLTDAGDGTGLETRLRGLLDNIAQPMQIGKLLLRVHASIGVTLYPTDGSDPDSLLRHADQAMYRAKAQGRNRFSLFDTVMEDRARERRRFLVEIERGLESGQFQLHFQPKVRLETGELFGFEALVRWHHPERGLLGPGGFLPYLDQSELEPVFGEAMIAQALERMAAWHEAGREVKISVNVSGAHLLRPGFVEWLGAALGKHPAIAADQLCLEIIESAAVADLHSAVPVLQTVRDLGVEVSIDDFGTGYSSLSYLRTLPVDELKIDRSFVLDMLNDASDEAIVRSVIGLAAAFGIRVVAEGVETEAHVRRLLELCCDLGQGYAFSPAIDPQDVLGWIQSSSDGHG